jgi:hypothetical protein
MTENLLFAAILPWMGVGGIASSFAKRHGFGEWKWFLASLATGPVSWVVLYVKVRDKRERVGPKRLPSAVPKHIDTV